MLLTISYQTNTTRETLETILNIQPKDSGGGSGETRESIVMKQAQDMLSRLPEDYIPHEVMTTFSLCSQFSFHCFQTFKLWE